MLSQEGELSVICGPSTQRLFPPKQIIAESGTSINSEQSFPGNVLRFTRFYTTNG